jgi:hypothetical protein
MVRTIKHTAAQEIIDIACDQWRERLFNQWGRAIVLKQSIDITEDQYIDMRRACATGQSKLFDTIFGKDEPRFKIGDFIMFESSSCNAGPYEIEYLFDNGKGAHDQNGDFRDIECLDYRLATEEEIKKFKAIPDRTPCLVRDHEGNAWRLFYSNGRGEFYANGRYRSEETVSWKYSRKLDMDNLPTM